MRRFVVPFALVALVAAGRPAAGQSILQRAKQKAKEQVDKAADKAEKEGDKATEKVEKDGAPTAPTAPAVDAPSGAPGQGAWLNYDFVPGSRTIFYEDFEGNEVGDFPRRFRLQEGNLEVVRIGGKPMLRSKDGGTFFVKLPEKLPSRFTVELVYHSPTVTNPIHLTTTASDYQRSAAFGCYPRKAFVDGNEVGPNSGNESPKDPGNGFVTCRFTVDNGRGMKAYVDEYRTANAPGDSVVLTDTLFIQIPSGDENDPTLLASLRVAAGGRKLYDVLAAEGRVSTQGIFFDTGSDRLRAESTPTLTEIGTMLKEHPDLKIEIDGHTDNVGAGAGNQTLSEQRAASVRQYLVDHFQVAPARLTAKGYGATKPVAPNTTPEGRQNNRRVELVKMP